MNLNVVYGQQLEYGYLDAGEVIRDDALEERFAEIRKKVNNAFFGG